MSKPSCFLEDGIYLLTHACDLSDPSIYLAGQGSCVRRTDDPSSDTWHDKADAPHGLNIQMTQIPCNPDNLMSMHLRMRIAFAQAVQTQMSRIFAEVPPDVLQSKLAVAQSEFEF